MKFVKEVTGEKMAIPAAALKLCGFENGDKAELHALPSAAIILKQKMTAMEVIQAIGVITAGGSLIWTVIVPAFPPPCASHQTIRIPLLAAEA